MSDFSDHTSSNGTKGAVHGALGTLAVMCAIYNAVCWWRRREQHSAVNVAVYLSVVGYEFLQVKHHCR